MIRLCLSMLLVVGQGGIDTWEYVRRTASRAGCIRSILVFVLLLFATVSESQAEQTRHILILNSYHKGFQWTDDQTSAITEVLTRSVDNLELYVEYMDTKRIYTPEYLEYLLHTFHLKYDKIKFDAIVATDDNALRFAMKHHTEVFSGAPVSFCGINDYYPAMLEGKDAFAGLIEVLDVKATINLAMKLHEGIQTVYVITDNTPTGTGQQRDVQAVSKQYKDVEFKYLSGKDYSHPELLEKLKTLPENSVALLTVWLRDKTDTYVPVDIGGPAISSASTVPVYGIITMYLEYGIVGGKLLSSQAQGTKAAELILRVLAGENPADIGVITESVNPYIFDFAQFQRWNIDKTRLPADSIIVNEPISFYYQYHKYIWTVIAIVIVQSILIIALFITIASRKRAEKALKTEKDRLAKAQEIGSIGTWELDLVKNVLTWTKENHNIFGIPDGTDLTYETFLACVHPGDRKYVNTEWTAAIDGKPYDIEHRIISNGKVKWVREKAELSFDNNGKVIRSVGVTQDVTERKQAEQESKRLMQAIEQATETIVITGVDGTIQYVNPAFEHITGYTRDEATGNNMRILKSGKQDNAFYKDMWDTLVQGQTWSGEIINKKKDGTLYTEEVTISPVRNDAGETTNYVGVKRDITKRKQAEEELLRYATIVSISSDMMAILDADFTYLAANKAYLAAFGMTKDQIVGHTAPQVFGEEFFETTIKPHAEHCLKGNEVHYEDWFQFPVHGLRFMSVGYSPFIGPQGNIKGFVVNAKDITERKQAEIERERLLKAVTVKNKELQSVVYVASHDLRSPLVNIEGFGGELANSCQQLGELLRDAVFDETKAKEASTLINEYIPESIKFIKAGTAKMSSLLTGLLQVSRVGSKEVVFVPLDMNKITNEIRHSMAFQINEAGAKLVIEDLPNCLGDGDMINQVFSNLIGNALKYIDPERKPEIHISGRIEHGNSIYCVEDNGIGIDPAHQDKIFELFHRLDPADTAGGEGLGLTIVTRILDRLNGSISVESEPGKGSKFFVSLPIAKP